MPLIIEEDQRALNGFDASSATTLFWKAIPVVVRQHDREDQTEDLTFRILSGTTRQNHSLRVLRVHISSEEDPFFLHTLEVSEEEFQGLKAEQGILVDFANFPGKIISLLDKCQASQETDMPRFQAVLLIRPGESTFKIVETNDFKQLPHITLAFRPGNDFAVKQFLAFRLAEVKEEYCSLTTTLGDTQEERDSLQKDLGQVQARLSELQAQHDRQVLEWDAKLREQAVAAQQEALKERAALQEAAEREQQEAAKRSSEQLEALGSRVSELDADNRALRDAKYKLDAQVSELSAKLGSAQGCQASLEQEVAGLRGQLKELAADKHGIEVKASDSKAKLLAAEDKLAAQAQVIAQQQARLADLEGGSKQWEARCQELKALAAGHEGRAKEAASEVLKGNAIIERLQTDLRLAREKVKRKQAILVRQEEEAAAKEAALAEAGKKLAAATAGGDSLRQQVALLQEEAGELRAKLEESKGQLQSNEQMIRWLNQQVTDAQLQVSAVPGSRYHFRPSAAAAGAASSSMLRTPGATLAAAGGSGGYSSSAMGAGAAARLGAGAGPGGGMGSSGGSAAAFMPTTGKLLGKGIGGGLPHTTMSFSPETVTPLPAGGGQKGVLPTAYGSAISAGGLAS